MSSDALAALAMEAEGAKPMEIQLSPSLGVTTVRKAPCPPGLHILDIGAGIEVGVACKTFLGELLAFYGLAMAFAAVVVSFPLRSTLWQMNCAACPSSCVSWWSSTISALNPWPIVLPTPKM